MTDDMNIPEMRKALGIKTRKGLGPIKRHSGPL